MHRSALVRRSSPLLWLLVAAWLVVPSTAQAAAGFVPAAALGGSGQDFTYHPNVASAPDGTALAAWISPGSPARANVAVRAPGGDWRTQELGPCATVQGGLPVDVAADGTATVLVVDEAGKALRAHTRPPGGAFAAPVVINAASRPVTAVALAVNASGQAVAAWHENTTGSLWQPHAAYRGAGGWGAPAPLTSTAALSPFAVAEINDAGRAAVATQSYDGTYLRSRASIRPVGGAFPAEATLLNPEAGHAFAPSIALTPAGAVVAGYVRTASLSPATPDAVWKVAPAAGTTFGAAQLLSGAGVYAEHLVVAAGPGDALHAAWTSVGTNRTEYGIGSVGSVGVSRQLVSPVDEIAKWPKLAVDAAGNRFLAWTNMSSFLVQGAYRPAGASDFSLPQTVIGSTGAANFTRATVAVDAQGNGLVGWAQQSVTGWIAQAAGYDVSPPTLSGFAVPAALAATRTGTFGVTARDTWSTPTVSWAFGDGASASGASAAHAYGGAGSFTATVTATDAVGNTTSLGAPVLVGELDADGDGAVAARDCDDANAGVNPLARDVPGNGVDENCDGRDGAFATLSVNAELTWVRRLGSPVTRIQTLRLEGVRDGDVVRLSCTGKGCRKSTTRTRTLAKTKRGRYDLSRAVRGLALRPKAKLTVAVQRPEHVTRIFTYEVRRGKNPRRVARCQAPGEPKARAC